MRELVALSGLGSAICFVECVPGRTTDISANIEYEQTHKGSIKLSGVVCAKLNWFALFNETEVWLTDYY